MSQAGIINVIDNNPEIPITFVADAGSAVALFNILNVLGTGGITTSGAGNTITINGAGIVAAMTLTGNSGGALSPTANNWNIFGAAVAAGTSPVATSGAVSTLTVNVQRSQAIAATNASNVGLAAFNSAQFTVDGNGFVSLIGGPTPAIDSLGVQATSGAGTNPVFPDGSGIIQIEGSLVAAGTNPLRSVSTAANTLQMQIQTSTALAAEDSTRVGLANFDSASFAVSAGGFVTAAATGLGKTLTGDTGGALPPTANNWNILGGPGVTVTGAGSTLTVNSVVFTDQGASTTIASDNAYFVTGAFAMTLPAAPLQGELCIVYADTTSTVTVTANAGQVIRLGTNVTAAAGSITSGSRGDSISLRYRTSGAEWNAVSATGGWIF